MFYDTLKEVCRSHGTTPTAVCKSLSLSTGCVTSWKNGAVPNMSTVERIASHLSVPVTSLMSESSPPQHELHTQPPPLSPSEQEIIDLYRISPDFRAAVDSLVRLASPASKNAASSNSKEA